MERVNLSILVVNCKNYVPSYNWYLCKSGGYFCGTANSPDDASYKKERHNEYDTSDDYVLMPDCPGMSDEEAAEVVMKWCEQNQIPYNDDMDNIEAAYEWYYKYGDGISDYTPMYHKVDG